MDKKVVAILITASFGLIAIGDGCSGGVWSDYGLAWDENGKACCPTDPKDPDYNDDDCVEGRAWDAYREDAGIDGAGCSPPMWPSGEPQSDELVESVCIPNAPDHFDPPQPLWVGPKAEDPGCLPEIGAFGDRRYDDLVVPDAGCPACVCGPIEGSCSPGPNNILLRADFCDVSQTTTSDFSAPKDWDGSCTNLHAMPAGAECPVGSGIPCAQSIYTSTLLDPVEKCESIPVPIPKARADAASSSIPTRDAHSDLPTWDTHLLSCNATPIALDCPDHDSKRFAVLPKGWRHCVRHRDKGIHECPSDSKYTNQVIAYSDKGYTDTRQCTECGCKASGGTCYGSFNVYEDEQCTKFIQNDILNSETYACTDLMPGQAVGSKELVDLTYVPGKCEPTGGLAIGTVEKNDADAVTWCCLAQ